MPWYSLRAVYVHGADSVSPGLFEERILLFRAPDLDCAFARAKEESGRYLALNPAFRRIGNWVAFHIRPTADDLDGAEVWSGLSTCDDAPDDYYHRRYTAFEIQPEPPG